MIQWETSRMKRAIREDPKISEYCRRGSALICTTCESPFKHRQIVHIKTTAAGVQSIKDGYFERFLFCDKCYKGLYTEKLYGDEWQDDEKRSWTLKVGSNVHGKYIPDDPLEEARLGKLQEDYREVAHKFSKSWLFKARNKS